MTSQSVPEMSGQLSRSLMCLLLILPGLAFSHSNLHSDTRFDRIGVENGLSNGSVNAIFQDNTGFMWFGTEDGLNRYDGRNFVVYRHEPGNPNSLSSSNFGAILQDSRGRLWLGTWGGGLNRLDLETGVFMRYQTNDARHGAFRGLRTEFIFEDSQGDIWIGTESSGLNRYLSEQDRFENFSHDPANPQSLASDSVKAIAESPDGKIWIGTDDGLYLFMPAANRFERQAVPGSRFEGSERIRSIAPGENGTLWIGTRGDGLKLFDPLAGTWTELRHDPANSDGLSENAIARVFVDSTGAVWVATYTSGLDKLDPETGQFRHFDYITEADDEGVSFRRMDAIYEDRGGVLWFGTRGGGINKAAVRPKGFKNYRYRPGEAHGLPHPTVRSIAGRASSDSGSLWVGTDGGGLARYDMSEGHFEVFGPGEGAPEGLKDGRVWATLVDSRARVWVGTYSTGLYLLKDATPPGIFRRFAHEPGRADSLSSDRVHALLETRDEELWIGTVNGLNRLRSLSPGGASFQRYMYQPNDPSSLSSSHITALLQDKAGKIWVGTLEGLNVLDPETGTATRYLYDPDDPGTVSTNHIMSLFEDASGTIWVGTDEGGLDRFDRQNKRFVRLSSINEQSGGKIAGMAGDTGGQLWLGTGRGLGRFDFESGDIRSFGASDGLRTLSFLRGAAFVSGSGELFFGGLRGMVSFIPAEILENLQPPALAFTSISRFDQGAEIPVEHGAGGDLISLDHDAAFIRFEFAALDYLNPMGNQYAYKLEGVDRDWVRAGNQNTATYSGLKPGEYLFRARGSNGDGAWNEAGIEMRVLIWPPYWQTWWFRTFAVLIAGLLVYSLFLLRVSGIRAKNLQLEHLNDRLLTQIRERNRIEGERESLIVELEGRNAEMERFTYTVSHDLKSPLITIRGFLGLLREDYTADRKEQVAADLDKIESATMKMNQLLDELLQLSRAGRAIDKLEEVGFREVVDEVLKLARGELDAREVNVIVLDPLPTVFADRVRLTEVVLNLVTNATRFMGDQAHPEIEIGVRNTDELAIFFIRDNGIGIDPAHQQQVFDLFERLNPETPGTGIGLALVRRIIEMHGGEVWVESAGPGQGSTFCFTLPVRGGPMGNGLAADGARTDA